MGLWKSIKESRSAAREFNAAAREREAAQAAEQAAAPPTPDQLEGAAREQHAESEVASRDAARAAYLAPDRAPVAFTRIATRGKTQAEEVAAYLGTSGLAARPELAYGVYRVPDRISPTISGFSERGRVVEWDVVHAATTTLPAAAPAAVASFDAQETWVARLAGEPSILDEDLALAYLGYASVAPEQSLGIARHVVIDGAGGGDDGADYMAAQVTGVHVFHAPGLGEGVHDQMKGNAPLRLPVGAPEGFRVEVLDWAPIAERVHPRANSPFLVPSPYPHLPSTPQELLRAYLEIVGIQPAHCYSAQVTEDEPRELRSRIATDGWFTLTSNVGFQQLCADGKERRRLFGGSRIVVVYRDEPVYSEGRGRWERYVAEVLQIALSADEYEAVQKPGFTESLPGGVRGVVKTADFMIGVTTDPWKETPPHRYCWPPAG